MKTIALKNHQNECLYAFQFDCFKNAFFFLRAVFTVLNGISGKVFITWFQKSQPLQCSDNIPGFPGKESKGKFKMMKCRKHQVCVQLD